MEPETPENGEGVDGGEDNNTETGENDGEGGDAVVDGSEDNNIETGGNTENEENIVK